jgi:isopenicillin N synthase-like dioxygenase
MGIERLYALGGEGTKRTTDQKEDFYGGPELKLTDEHPLKDMPTYGENQFPDEDVPEMRKLVFKFTLPRRNGSISP